MYSVSRSLHSARPAVVAGFSCLLLTGIPVAMLNPEIHYAQAQVNAAQDNNPITVVQAEKDGTILQVQKNVAAGGEAIVRGENWGAGSTVTVKLNIENNAQLTRTQDIINHPGNGQPDQTIWAQFNADSQGSFTEKITLPANLKAGQALRVNAASGLITGQEQHSLTSPWLVVGGVEYVPPKKEIIECTNTTPKPEVKAAATAENGKVKISGTGFCNAETGGARVAFKYNAGQVTRSDGKYDNATIWHVEQADPNNGTFDFEMDLPTPATSKDVLKEGEHSIQVLSGSLKENDPVFTARLPFVIGEYRPSVPPEPVHYEEDIPVGTEHDLKITESNNSLRVTVNGGKKDDWIFATTYIADGSPRLPWGNYWARLNDKGEVVLPLDTVNGRQVRIPEGKVKLVIQSGNQDDKNKVLGWDWWEPKKPSTNTPNGPATRPGVNTGANTGTNAGNNAGNNTGNNTANNTGANSGAGANGTAGTTGNASNGASTTTKTTNNDIQEFTAALGTLDGELKKLLAQVEKPAETSESSDNTGAYSDTPDYEAAHYDDGTNYADDNYRVVQASTADNVNAGIAAGPAAATTAGQTGGGQSFAVDSSAIQQPENPAGNWPAQPQGELNQPVDKREDLDESNSGGLSAAFDGDIVYVLLPSKQPGDWVFLHIYTDDKDKTTPVGWAQVDEFGEIAFDTSGLPDGSYTLAISDNSGLLGWVDLDLGNELAKDTMGRNAASPRLATAGASAMRAEDWLLIAAGVVLSAICAAVVAFIARKKN